jgi:hypothetical protein
MTTFTGFEKNADAEALARRIAALVPDTAAFVFDRSYGVPTMTASWLIGGVDEDGVALGWRLVLIFGGEWETPESPAPTISRLNESEIEYVFDNVKTTLDAVDLSAANARRHAGEDIDDEIRIHIPETYFGF